MRSSGWLALVALVLSVGACSKPKSFIVLNLRSADTTEISGVTQVVVTVSQAPAFSKTLTYPAGKVPLVINQVNVNDLSISFTGARSGPVDLSVDVKTDAGCVVGHLDDVSVSIRQGDIAFVGVALEALTCATGDGGADAGQTGDAFPGCDPVTPALVCAAGQTCQIDCKTTKGECTNGGNGGPGAPCMMNLDCAPGLQCFDYSATGCAVKVCLRFCNDDNGCSSGGVDGGAVTQADAGASEAGAGDAGGAEGGVPSSASSVPRSVCQGLVPCNGVITAYHTCTFACDPRQAAAAAGSTRCPAGLSCLVVGSMDQVDCACAEPTRKGTDGTVCTGGADCAPGYICNQMGDTKTCRAICRCDNAAMSCTAPNECGGGKVCSALTNETTFGVCL